MATKKVYAVKKGHTTGIFESWEACKAAVEGFSGAEYKGFGTKAEAEQYLGGTDWNKTGTMLHRNSENGKADSRTRHSEFLEEDMLIAYVDGSYEHSLLKYAFGCVFLVPDGSIYTENGCGNNTESAKLRNVTGEMLGSMFAVRWAIVNGFRKIEIRYDYEGVEKWVTGAWKSKTELTMKYAESMRKWNRQIQICFTKVTAHANVYYNEMADQLAKDALVTKDGIPGVRLIADMESLQ